MEHLDGLVTRGRFPGWTGYLPAFVDEPVFLPDYLDRPLCVAVDPSESIQKGVLILLGDEIGGDDIDEFSPLINFLCKTSRDGEVFDHIFENLAMLFIGNRSFYLAC